jgi:hypothetical protein
MFNSATISKEMVSCEAAIATSVSLTQSKGGNNGRPNISRIIAKKKILAHKKRKLAFAAKLLEMERRENVPQPPKVLKYSAMMSSHVTIHRTLRVIREHTVSRHFNISFSDPEPKEWCLEEKKREKFSGVFKKKRTSFNATTILRTVVEKNWYTLRRSNLYHFSEPIDSFNYEYDPTACDDWLVGVELNPGWGVFPFDTPLHAWAYYRSRLPRLLQYNLHEDILFEKGKYDDFIDRWKAKTYHWNDDYNIATFVKFCRRTRLGWHDPDAYRCYWTLCTRRGSKPVAYRPKPHDTTPLLIKDGVDHMNFPVLHGKIINRILVYRLKDPMKHKIYSVVRSWVKFRPDEFDKIYIFSDPITVGLQAALTFPEWVEAMHTVEPAVVPELMETDNLVMIRRDYGLEGTLTDLAALAPGYIFNPSETRYVYEMKIWSNFTAHFKKEHRLYPLRMSTAYDHNFRLDANFLVGVEDNPGPCGSKFWYDSSLSSGEEIVPNMLSAIGLDKLFQPIEKGSENVAASIDRASESFARTAQETKESFQQSTNGVKESFDSLRREGIPLKVDPEAKVKVDFNMFSFLDPSAIFAKFSGLGSFLGSEVKSMIDIVLSNDLAPAAKRLLYIVSIGAISLILSKFPERSGLVTMACYGLQWAIALYSGEAVIKSFVGILQGIEIIPKLAYSLMAWMSNEEIEAVPNMAFFEEQVVDRDWALHSTFTQYIYSLMPGVNAGGVMEILKACSTFQKVCNGLEFTAGRLYLIVSEVTNFVTDPLGYKLFERAYSRYPELYVLDRAVTLLREKVTKGEHITSDDARDLRNLRVRLDAVRRSIPMSSDFTVYHTQAQHLSLTMAQMELIFGQMGLNAKGARRRMLEWLIIGNSQVGKSKFWDRINSRTVKQIFGETIHNEYMADESNVINNWYFREFEDNYVAGTKIAVMDDWAQTPKATDPERCPGYMLIPLSNNKKYIVNKSAINMKGITPFDPDICQISSNIKKISTDQFHVVEIEALINRVRQTWRLCVHEEYRQKVTENTYKLDLQKMGPVYDSKVHYLEQIKWDPKGMPETTGVVLSVDQWEMYYIAANRENIEREEDLLRKDKFAQSSNDIFHISYEDIPFSASEILKDPNIVNDFLKDVSPKNRVNMNDTFTAATRMDLMQQKARMDDANAVRNYTEMTGEVPSFFKTSFLAPSAIIWKYVSSEDPEWVVYGGKKFNEIFNWMTGSPDLKYVKTMMFQAYSPTTAPAAFKTLGLMLRSFLYRAFEASRLSGMLLSDIFDCFMEMPFTDACKLSVHCMIIHMQLQARNVLRTLGDMWTYMFSFNNAWLSNFLSFMGGACIAMFTAEKVIANYNKHAVKMTRRPAAKHGVVTAPIRMVTGLPDEPHSGAPKGCAINRNTTNVADSILNNNVAGVFIGGKGTEHWVMNVLFVRGRLGIVTEHLGASVINLIQVDPYAKGYILNYAKGSNSWEEFEWRFCKQEPDRSRDLNWIYWHSKSGVHERHDICDHFLPSDIPMQTGTGVTLWVSRFDDEKWNVQTIMGAVRRSVFSYTLDNPDKSKTIQYRVDGLVLSAPSVEGSCISFAMRTDSSDTRSGICGLVVAGSPLSEEETKKAIYEPDHKSLAGKLTYITLIDRDYVNHCVESMEKKYGAYVICKLPITPNFRHPHLPSQFVIEEIIIESRHVPNKTRLRRTKFFGEFGPVEKIPAILGPYQRLEGDGSVTFVDPQMMEFCKYDPPSPYVNIEIWEAAKIWTIKKFKSIFNDDYLAKDRCLTLDEVVNGYGTIEGWPRSTSMGFTYGRMGFTKQDMFGDVGDRRMDTEPFLMFEENYYDTIRKQGCREVHRTTYNMFLKSEALLTEKVMRGKVRLILGVDFDKYAQEKRLRGFVHDLFNCNPLVSGSAAGFNPHSDAGLFEKCLRGWNLFDGDVGGWDKIFYDYFSSACDDIYEALMPNSTPEERWERACDSWDSRNARVAVTLDDCTAIVRMVIGTRSGGVKTLYTNTFGNNVLGRYGYFLTYLESINVDYRRFSQAEYGELDLDYHMNKFDMIVLGDDEVCMVRPDAPYCNFNSFARAMGTLNIEYTDATKTVGPSPDYKPLSEIQFCKRRLRFDEELKDWFMDLDWGSIYNALNWTEAEDNDFCQVIDGMICEISAKGREVWNDKGAALHRLANIHYGHYSKFDTFDKAVEFLKHSNGPVRF